MNNDRPWMTALEMQFAAMRVCRIALDARGGEPLEPDFNAHLKQAERMLRSAESYSWSNDSVAAVRLASRTIPEDTRMTLSLMPPSSTGWWWFDDGLGHPNFRGLIWGVDNGAVEFKCFVYRDDIGAPAPGFSFNWVIGSTLRDLNTSGQQTSGALPGNAGTMTDIARFFMAACTWLQQRVVVMSSGHIERHRRKQIAREYGANMSDVKVIQLRRSESRQNTGVSTDDDKHIDWSCRWIVNGHWRNQPYKDERKLIYIMPFVKGPEDKPLKTPSHTVYAVNR